MIRTIANTLAATTLLATLPAVAADYTQAAGSTLAFATQYDGDTFSGTLPGFTTRLSFDPANLPAARLDVTIPLAAARTGNADRDNTLHGSDFFNADKFPQAHYVARAFRSLGNGDYAADGTLDLHGIRKPVTLTFHWTPGAKPVLAGKAVVKRLDFGIGTGDWADTALIPNAVAISTRVVLAPR